MQIDVHRAPPFLEVHLVGRTHRTVNARVVHEDVQRVENRVGGGEEPFHLVGRGNVAAFRDDALAGQGDARLQGFGEFDGGLFVPRAEENAGPLAYEGFDDGPARVPGCLR